MWVVMMKGSTEALSGIRQPDVIFLLPNLRCGYHNQHSCEQNGHISGGEQGMNLEGKA